MTKSIAKLLAAGIVFGIFYFVGNSGVECYRAAKIIALQGQESSYSFLGCVSALSMRTTQSFGVRAKYVISRAIESTMQPTIKKAPPWVSIAEYDMRYSRSPYQATDGIVQAPNYYVEGLPVASGDFVVSTKDGMYGKNSHDVFFWAKKIRGALPDSFEVLVPRCVEHVCFDKNGDLDQCPSYLAVVSERVKISYAKDENRVYLEGDVVADAYAETFKILDNVGSYSKDHDTVFYYGKPMVGADAASFVAFNTKANQTAIDKIQAHTGNYSCLLPNATGYARDKNHAYRYGSIIPESELPDITDALTISL